MPATGSASTFTRLTISELQRQLRFHDQDRGTMTMREECRRMYLVQELSAELQRRGIDPWARCSSDELKPVTDWPNVESDMGAWRDWAQNGEKS